jgi:hypothetical protein
MGSLRADNRQVVDTRSQFDRLYATVPRSDELLAAVRAGQREFLDLLARVGYGDARDASASVVHDYREVELHAFILGIVSGDRWGEVQAKSFLTYGSHWIDDFFDAPAMVKDGAQLTADRGDIRRALANMGRSGEVGFAMADRVEHHDAVFKALHRMLYGGLVQRSLDYRERLALVGEYFDVATEYVSAPLAREIRRLNPQAFWTTNKTVQELLFAAERTIDFEAAELWNLVYAPAIYFQDAAAERAAGELNFEEGEAPDIAAMLPMVALGAKHVVERCAHGSLALRQLDFVMRSVPNLPRPIAEAYRAILNATQAESIAS